MAATAGIRATRLAFSQQRLFLGAMRAIHRDGWGRNATDRSVIFFLPERTVVSARRLEPSIMGSRP